MLTSIDLDRYGYWMEAGGASPGTVRPLHANIKEAVDEVTSSVHAPVVWGRTMHTA